MEYLEALKEAIDLAKFPDPIIAKKTRELVTALDADLSAGGYRSGEDFDDAYDGLVDALNNFEETSKEKPSVVVDGDEEVEEIDLDDDDSDTIDDDEEEEILLDDEDDE